VFNAANEECVAAFLAGSLRFTAIVDSVASVVSVHEVIGRDGTLTLDDVLGAESWARQRVAAVLTGEAVLGENGV
jgi:1-deoxy-D-xylulose-5-phosphate reductoisomerase